MKTKFDDGNGAWNADSVVEEALRTYPFVPAPAALRLNVMKRIRTTAPVLRFRLTWLDYAMSLFATVMAATPFIVWQFITPQMIVTAQVELFILSQHFNPSFLLPLLLNS